jgi:WD40 repeat protein/serine/threonine protein kinase
MSVELKSKEIFLSALATSQPADRDAYLREACGSDVELRQYVEALLKEHEAADSLLDQPRIDVRGAVFLENKTPLLDRPVSERPGSLIGPYKLLEQIGEGGFGVVFMAEQERPVRRRVAVKVIKPGMDTRQVIARFEAERQALALMDHPNIAKVLEAGATESGRPYFVMELVRGIPLTEFCDQNCLTVDERLALFMTVCHAVQHAHQKGIIHRDLKPTNVLVTLHDGKPVPKVIDFGVAKATGQQLTERTLFTAFAQLVGTPLYMSPEQAEMSGLDVDTRSDIYSLGVMLYELLTGTTPFDKERLREAAYDEIRRIIRHEEPPKPSTRISTLGPTATAISTQRKSEPDKLRRLVRGELDWIVMKCLDKDRNRRYETANSLARDVERYLHDEPVQACPPAAGYRLRKLLRRNRGPVAAAALVFVALVAGMIGTTLGLFEARRQTDVAKAAAQAELAAKEELEGTLYYNRIALAERKMAAHEILSGLELLNECPEKMRDWEWHYLRQQWLREPNVLPNASEDGCHSVAFHPDGNQFVTGNGNGSISIWDLKTGKIVTTFPAHDGRVFSVDTSADGKYLVSAATDKTVKVWEWHTKRELNSYAGYGSGWDYGVANSVAFHPTAGQFAAGDENGDVIVRDIGSGQERFRCPSHSGFVSSVGYSADGRWLASGSWGGDVRIWDAQTGVLVPKWTWTCTHPVSSVMFDPHRNWLYAACFDHSIWACPLDGGKPQMLRGHTNIVTAAVFSPDGRRIASAGSDSDFTVRLWDPRTHREALTLQGNSQLALDLAFSPDGRHLVSAGKYGVQIWKADPLAALRGEERLDLTVHTSEVWRAVFSPDGQQIASASSDRTVRLWNSVTGEPGRVYQKHSRVVFCVDYSSDGRIASVSVEGGGNVDADLRIWDPATGVDKHVMRGGKTYFNALFTPDAKHVIAGGSGQVIDVWDAATGSFIRSLPGHDAEVAAISFNNDGSRMVSATPLLKNTIILWDTANYQQLDVISGEVAPGVATGVALSPDGTSIACGGAGAPTVVLMNVATKERREFAGHTARVLSLVFSPDGRILATGGSDCTIKLWDVATGKALRTLRGHTGSIDSLDFNHNGTQLVSASRRDNTVKVWDVALYANR